jgi:hypothetical protein
MITAENIKILPKSAYNRLTGKRGDLAAAVYRMNVEANMPGFLPTEDELRNDFNPFEENVAFDYVAELEVYGKGQAYRIVDSLLAETVKYESTPAEQRSPDSYPVFRTKTRGRKEDPEYYGSGTVMKTDIRQKSGLYRLFFEATHPGSGKMYFWYSELQDFCAEMLATSSDEDLRERDPAKVLDQGRKGPDNRGFFCKATRARPYGRNSRDKNKAKIATVYYCAGNPAPTDEDWELLFLTEPTADLTEGQAELKRKFAKMGDRWMSRAEVEAMLDANGDASETEGAKTAKELVDWAHGVDVWQNRPLYIEKNPMDALRYRKVCYAGWIDRDLWAAFPRVEPRSAAYFKQARKFGPYSTNAKSEQYNPMNGCNPIWQEEAALETGACVIDGRGMFVGAKVIAQEREQAHKANREWELQEVAKWVEEKRRKAKAEEKRLQAEADRKAKEAEDNEKRRKATQQRLDYLDRRGKRPIAAIMRELEDPNSEASGWARRLPKLDSESQEIMDRCRGMFAFTTVEECESVLEECSYRNYGDIVMEGNPPYYIGKEPQY